MSKKSSEEVQRVQVEFEDEHLRVAYRASGLSYEEFACLAVSTRDSLRAEAKAVNMARIYGASGKSLFGFYARQKQRSQ